jgi:hypothetical protein
MLPEALCGLQVFIYPWMFMFWLKNFSKCYKLLIYLIYTQIIVDGSAIFHLFMYY